MAFSRKFHEQAAKFSLWTPLCVLGVNVVLGFGLQKGSVGALIVGIGSWAFLSLSFVLGVIALCGMRTHGKEKIFGKALAGVLVSLGFIAGAAFLSYEVYRIANGPERVAALVGTWESKDKTNDGGETVAWLRLRPDMSGEFRIAGAAQAECSGGWRLSGENILLKVERYVSGNFSAGDTLPFNVNEFRGVATDRKGGRFHKLPDTENKSLADLEKEYLSASVGVYQYPSWIAGGDMKDANIVFFSHDNRAEYSRMVRSFFREKFSIMQVTLVNKRAAGEQVLDLSKTVVTDIDGKPVKTIPGAVIFNSLIDPTNEGMKKFFTGDLHVQPGKSAFLFLCFPEGTDWSRLKSATFSLNDEVLAADGVMYSPEEIKKLFGAAQAGE